MTKYKLLINNSAMTENPLESRKIRFLGWRSRYVEKVIIMGKGRPESESPRVAQKPGKATHTFNSRAPVTDGRGYRRTPESSRAS